MDKPGLIKEFFPLARYMCGYCSHVYDEAEGDPDFGIAPGTLWQDMPEDWFCTSCGQPKSAFQRLD